MDLLHPARRSPGRPGSETQSSQLEPAFALDGLSSFISYKRSLRKGCVCVERSRPSQSVFLPSSFLLGIVL